MTTFIVLTTLGCTGLVTLPSDDRSRPTGQPPTDDPLVLVDGRIQPRVWRLTPEQYTAAVRELLGSDVPELGTLSGGAVVNGLSNGSSNLRIDATSASGVFYLARDYAAWAAERAPSIMRCEGETFGTEACARAFGSSLATCAYRRPADGEEIEALVALFVEGSEIDPATGLEAMVHSVLASPFFLYRTELGEPITDEPDRRLLTDFEIASLVSMMLTNRPPDEALWADAAAGRLREPSVREAHARRLFASSGPVLHDFFDQWLDLGRLETVSKVESAYPAFDATLVAQMREETERFIDGVLLEGDGRFTTLFTASHTWVRPELAAVYGVAHPGGGLARVELPPDERAGLLTQASWLTTHAGASDSSIEKRGAFVWRSLLCEHIDPPPPSATSTIQALMNAGLTKRELVEARAENLNCAGCHQFMDPIGVGLERYDGIGGYRTEQDGVVLDVSGRVPTFGAFDGGIELAHLVAESERTQACFARRLAQYTLGTDLGGPESTEWLHGSFQEFVDEDLRVEALIAAIVRDPRFIERQSARQE